jgi:hypothetical protein
MILTLTHGIVPQNSYIYKNLPFCNKFRIADLIKKVDINRLDVA